MPGFSVLPPFAAYYVPYVTQESRQQILVEYAGRLNRLDDLTPLSFPSLDDFDDRLYPKT